MEIEEKNDNKFNFSKYKKEAVGVLILAIITITLGNAWNELMLGMIERYAENKNDYFIWIFIYALALTIVAILIVVYAFPYFELQKKS